MKYYLYTITEMYDGREFDWSKSVVELKDSEDINSFVKSRIENECSDDEDEDEDSEWDGEQFSAGESLFFVGSTKEITKEDYDVLVKHL